MTNDVLEVKVHKVIIDIVLFNCVYWPIPYLFNYGSAFHQRGFYCEDTSLRYPYIRSTISSKPVYNGGVGLNLAVMALTEYLNRGDDKREITLLRIRIPNWAYNIYCTIGIFLFGAACSQLTTDVMKYSIGRLRPHFYTVCQPDVCNGSFPQFQYHVNFNCTNPLYKDHKWIMKQLRLSFPSGHASMSMYTLLYLAIYLQKRMTWDFSPKLLKHTLQFIAVVTSIYISMTRISDYKHHWSDVVIGLLNGASGAIITTRFISTLFSMRAQKLELLKMEQGELRNLNVNEEQNA